MDNKSEKNKKEPVKDVVERLETSFDGLTDEDIKKRHEQYGYNEIEEKSISPFLKFLQYFWGPIPWMIEAAIILSAMVKDWTDFGIILLLLITNAVVGFIEEYQADNAVAALKEKLAITARTLRNSKWATIQAKDLVPGDIIRLRMGDIIPADAVLWQPENVKIDQSALTGESLPVDKEEGEKAFSGSILKQGESNAIVTAIGSKTYFGKTTSLVEEAHTVSHFQRAVLKIGNYLIIIAVFLVVLILAVSLYRGDEFLTLLRFSLVLTIAAIPVAMPTVLSVTMVVGAKELSKRQAVVRKLSSIEELAGIDILCSDKTGTLTQNKLDVGDISPFNNYKQNDILTFAVLASKEENEDPIDLAIIHALKDKSLLKDYTVEKFSPFDPVRKRTEAVLKGKDNKTVKVSKGAPQVILALADTTGEIKEKADKVINDFAERGYRSLGIARTDSKGNWVFMGIMALFDPPREDSKSTIQMARDMGIEVKMVTGDQEAIAKETSSLLGLGRNILNASIFGDTKHHESGQLNDKIESADGFAEVYPEHKYHIVDVLQHRNHMVGMTGDGVNDAPALKKADAGVAVSGATSAARAAADIVLTNPGLSVIIHAIKESRKIFQRMNSYTIYRMTETIRVLFFMTLSILIFNFYPVTAVMIVLLALLNDGAILSIAYDNVKGSNKPEAWNMPLVFSLSTVLGLIGVIESFGVLYLAKSYFHLSNELIQTIIYLKLSVAGHLTIFVTRTRKNFWTHKPSKALLFAVIITQFVATLISVYGLFMTPIGWKIAGLVWAYCLVWFLIEDFSKIFLYNIIEEERLFLVHPGRKRRKRSGILQHVR